MKTKTADINDQDKQHITLFDLLIIFAKRKKQLLLLIIITYALLVAYVMIPKISLPDYYEPKAVISIRDSISALKNTSANSLDIISILSSGSDEVKDTNESFASILINGNTLMDKITDDLNFASHYKLEKSVPSEARALARLAFQRSLFVSGSRNYLCPVYTMSYRDEDPFFAKTVLKRTIEVLEMRLKEILSGQVSMRRATIDRMIAFAELSKQEAQDDLVRFNIANGAINLSDQAQSLTRQLGDINADMVIKELEMQSLLEYFSEDSPKILLLRNQIENGRQAINQLRSGFPDLSHSIAPGDKLPELSMEYLSLKSELEVQTRILNILKELSEQAKIDENDNGNVFQVIEPPEDLKLPTGPNRMLSLILGFFACIFLSISGVLLADYIRGLLKNENEAGKWQSIKAMMFNKSKTRGHT